MSDWPRIHSPDVVNSAKPILSGEAFHYLVHVLRKRVGDRIVLFGKGDIETICLISEVKPDSLRLEVLQRRRAVTESEIDLMLLVATGKGKKLEEVVEGATALGVRRIVPFVGARSVARRENPNLQERLARIAEAASRQSKRTRVPEVSPVMADLASALKNASVADSLNCYLDEAGGIDPQQAVLSWTPGNPIAVCCGPEGGWSEEERNLFRQTGAVAVTLGPRILRTELAAVFAVGYFERLLSRRVAIMGNGKEPES